MGLLMNKPLNVNGGHHGGDGCNKRERFPSEFRMKALLIVVAVLVAVYIALFIGSFYTHGWSF